MLNKKLVVVSLVSLSNFLPIQVLAHEGHEHPESYLEDVKAEKGSEYELMLGDEELGSFVIKSAKVTSQGAMLKLEQTFLDAEITKTVKATVSDEKILTYNFSTGEEDYVIIVDFQNLDSGDNAGIRVVYGTEAEGRTISSEAIVVSKR